MAERKELSEQEQIFVMEYVRTGNTKEAAIKAGYSEKYAAKAGPFIRNKPRIAKEIAAIRAESLQLTRRAGAKIDDAALLQELWGLYLSSKSEIVKLKALELIGKHLGFFARDNEQNKPELVLNVNNIDIVAIAKKLEESC